MLVIYLLCYILIFWQSYAGLKEALRVCAAYRGTYLDMKDKADVINEEKVSELAEVMWGYLMLLFL